MCDETLTAEVVDHSADVADRAMCRTHVDALFPERVQRPSEYRSIAYLVKVLLISDSGGTA